MLGYFCWHEILNFNPSPYRNDSVFARIVNDSNPVVDNGNPLCAGPIGNPTTSLFELPSDGVNENTALEPLTIVTSNIQFKTGVNDHLIQYQFEFAYGQGYKLII